LPAEKPPLFEVLQTAFHPAPRQIGALDEVPKVYGPPVTKGICVNGPKKAPHKVAQRLIVYAFGVLAHLTGRGIKLKMTVMRALREHGPGSLSVNEIHRRPDLGPRKSSRL
jgi:hypothetical protein